METQEVFKSTVQPTSCLWPTARECSLVVQPEALASTQRTGELTRFRLLRLTILSLQFIQTVFELLVLFSKLIQPFLQLTNCISFVFTFLYFFC